MSFEIPEQAKYRITGGVVVLTVLAFVLPSLMAKSNQRFEENLSLHLKVPPKPKAPAMHIPTAQQVFDQVKPGKIVEPKVAERDVKVNLSQAMPLEKASYVPSLTMDKAIDIPSLSVKSEKPKLLAQKVPKPEIKKEKAPAVKAVLGGAHYEIQLGAFSHRKNAEFLVSRLNRAGYSAHFKDYYVHHQKFYQVLVGHESNKTKAIALRKQLAQNLQIQGIIITKG